MNYYIFRHGETISTKGIAPYGNTQFTTGILPEGHAAIEKMSEFLKNIPTDHNAASELLRVQQTVKIVTKVTGKVFEKDIRLNELLTEDGVEPPYPFTGYFIPRRKLLREFIKEMEIKYVSVAICTHGYIISGLKHLITKGEFNVEDVGDYPQPGILTILKDKRLEEIDFN